MVQTRPFIWFVISCNVMIRMKYSFFYTWVFVNVASLKNIPLSKRNCRTIFYTRNLKKDTKYPSITRKQTFNPIMFSAASKALSREIKCERASEFVKHWCHFLTNFCKSKRSQMYHTGMIYYRYNIYTGCILILFVYYIVNYRYGQLLKDWMTLNKNTFTNTCFFLNFYYFIWKYIINGFSVFQWPTCTIFQIIIMLNWRN